MLNKLSLRYKIGFIALIGFIGFTIYQTATYRLSVDVRDQLQGILTQDFTILKFANQVQVQFANLDKAYQASLAEADPDLLRDTDNKAMKIRLHFEVLKNKYQLDDPLFSELFKAFQDYVELTSSHTASVLANTLNYEQTLAGYSQVNALRERYNDVQQRFLDERYKTFETQLVEIEHAEEALVRFGLILGLSLSLILIVLAFIISRSLIRGFGNAVKVAEEIASGNLDQIITIETQDETGQLLQSLHAMRDVLKRQHEDNFARDKMQSFLGGLNEVMRGDRSLEELSSEVLSYLTKKLYAQHGAVYVLHNQRLNLIAEFAKSVDGSMPRSFALGETMVGQTALDKQAQIILDVPENYMTIGSGIGRAAPRSIMLVPIIFEEKLKAVIEIAAFHRFATDDLDLMYRCNDAIAIAMNSAQVRAEVAGILEKTQEQARELQYQRQELALFNQQLEEKTRDLDRQRNEVLDKNKLLEESRKALIEKSEALELSGRYKSQFLSTMSHELRTPLNSILILSDALRENSKHNLDERDVQHAEVIHAAGGDLLALINDILDLSKVEEGKMELVIDQIDSQSLAKSLIQQFEYQVKERHLDYQVNVAADAPKWFFSDKHRLQQIVKNFISNAIKFTEKGGVYVNIACPTAQDCHELGLADKAYISIAVRDTGLGVDSDKQQLIFEAFKQADGTTSRKYGGTGLGLTISRELAKLLGGKIYLKSQGIGKGSEFALIIPIGDESMLSQKEEKTALLQHKVAVKPLQKNQNIRILAIEDNRVFQEVLSSVFTKLQMHIDIAEDGQQALDALAKESYHCVISDLNLPDYEGVSLLKAMREMSALNDVPIIVFTAEDVSKQRRQEILQYADAIANKTPRSVLDISQQIQQMLHAEQDKKPYQKGHLANRVVLLVDDDDRNLYSLSAILEAEDIRVLTAKSGAEALQLLEQDKSIELMLLDIMMPEMDGYEVLARTRSQVNYLELPIIALTAKAMLGDKEKCLAEGATDYLAKPVNSQQLLDMISRYIA